MVLCMNGLEYLFSLDTWDQLLFWLFLDSLIEYKISIAASLVHHCFVCHDVFLVKLVSFLLLASEALLLKVEQREVFDSGIVKFKPLAIVGRSLVTLFDVAVIVPSVG